MQLVSCSAIRMVRVSITAVVKYVLNEKLIRDVCENVICDSGPNACLFYQNMIVRITNQPSVSLLGYVLHIRKYRTMFVFQFSPLDIARYVRT